MDFAQFVKRWLLITVGVLIASETSAGIHYDSFAALIVAVLLLSLCNVFLRPILMLFSLPFIILTMGLGIWIINALLFLLVGGLVRGFYVDSFWHALWGAVLVSFTGLVANMLFGTPGQARRGINVQVHRTGTASAQAQNPASRPAPHKEIKDDDVIDV